jgi:hypothetical protein
MRVLSNWDRGTLYWRTFDSGDTVYVFGHKEGALKIGEYADITHPKDAFQVQFKRGDLFGRTVIDPGTIYKNSGEYVLIPDDATGEKARLVEIAEATNVVIEGAVQFEPYGLVTQFIDRLGSPSDVTYVVKTAISKSISGSGESGTRITSGITDERGGKVGGGVTAEIPIKAVKVGVNVNGELSQTVISKVEREVTRQTSYSITSTESYEEERTETFVSRKLHAVTLSWRRRFVTGTVVLGSARTPFEATIGYVTSTQTLSFDSFAAMPPELQAEYRRQFSNTPNLSDGGVYREKSSAPVFVIYGGAKFFIPNPEVLQRLYGGWGAVVVVDDNVLNDIPTTPRDGTILKEENDPVVWRIENGIRRHITTPQVLERFGGWSVVRQVPDGSMSRFTIADPIV